MASKDGVVIEFEGLDEFITLMDNFSPQVEKELLKEMNKYRMQVEGATKALTPVLTNELTKSITSSAVSRDSKGFYYFTIGSDLPYALRMHEHQGQWGERTMLKQGKSYRGYVPGNKYLENAVRATEQDWVKAMENVLANTLGKGNF